MASMGQHTQTTRRTGRRARPDGSPRGGRPTPAQNVARWALGGLLTFAGVSHLTFARQEFLAQVPEWFPIDDDTTVVGSGVVEIALGAALAGLPRHRARIGLLTALFFVAVFPGNISQYLTGTDAFGLTSDRARAIRLLGQPVLVAWALWSTGAVSAVRRRGAS